MSGEGDRLAFFEFMAAGSGAAAEMPAGAEAIEPLPVTVTSSGNLVSDWFGAGPKTSTTPAARSAAYRLPAESAARPWMLANGAPLASVILALDSPPALNSSIPPASARRTLSLLGSIAIAEIEPSAEPSNSVISAGQLARWFEDVDLVSGGHVEVAVGVDREAAGGGEGAGQFVARDIGFGGGEVVSRAGFGVDAKDARSGGDVEVAVGGAAGVVGGDADEATAADAEIVLIARVGGRRIRVPRGRRCWSRR